MTLWIVHYNIVFTNLQAVRRTAIKNKAILDDIESWQRHNFDKCDSNNHSSYRHQRFSCGFGILAVGLDFPVRWFFWPDSECKQYWSMESCTEVTEPATTCMRRLRRCLLKP